MARTSLSKTSSILNLSRRQTALLQRILYLGNEMAELINPDNPLPSAEDRALFTRKWGYLRVELAKAMLRRSGT